MTIGWAALNAAILRSAALLVRTQERAEWCAEWQSELWYVLQKSGRGSQALAFSLGAFKDALWLRHNRPAPARQPVLWLQSPARCLAFLTMLAAVSAFFFFRGHVGCLAPQHPVFVHFWMIVMALMILPVTTSLALGDYPQPATSRSRRWIFLAAKVALILPIVFCGTLDAGLIVGAAAPVVQFYGALLSYILGFRWALRDQRRRCPVCLRLVVNPTRIGQPSQTFLELYGTEFFCIKGHGLLHVPEILTNYTIQRWLDLDPSWSGLFLQDGQGPSARTTPSH